MTLTFEEFELRESTYFSWFAAKKTPELKINSVLWCRPQALIRSISPVSLRQLLPLKFFHWWEHRKTCIFLADRTGDQASVHFLWAVPKGDGVVLYALWQDGVLSCQTQKSSAGHPHCPHIGQGPSCSSSSVISVTAHCFYVTCMGRHFVLVFTLESYLWIQSDYIPDNVSQKVTDNHDLFLTMSPNPHWAPKKSGHDFQHLLVNRSCSCSAPPEMSTNGVFKCPTMHQSP